MQHPHFEPRPSHLRVVDTKFANCHPARFFMHVETEYDFQGGVGSTDSPAQQVKMPK